MLTGAMGAPGVVFDFLLMQLARGIFLGAKDLCDENKENFEDCQQMTTNHRQYQPSWPRHVAKEILIGESKVFMVTVDCELGSLNGAFGFHDDTFLRSRIA